MEKNTATDDGAQLFTAFQEANQALVEGMVAAQRGNLKLAQSIIANWIEAFQWQAKNAQTLATGVEQEMSRQQEAGQRLAQQIVERYSDFLRASFSAYEPSLRLTENLQNCLLALASRFPRHIVDINEQILGSQSLGTFGWRAADIIELFQSMAPELLQAEACLEVNAASRGIYLLERSVQTPALWVHCGTPGEKMPAYQGDLATRRQKQATMREDDPLRPATSPD